MTAYPALQAYYGLVVCGIAYSILALVHLLRIVYGLEVRVGEWRVQMWISYVALIVSALLAFWVFRLSLFL